jgi:hypothetical protein
VQGQKMALLTKLGAPINNKYTTYNNNLPSSPKTIAYFRNERQVMRLDSSNWLSLVGSTKTEENDDLAQL